MALNNHPRQNDCTLLVMLWHKPFHAVARSVLSELLLWWVPLIWNCLTVAFHLCRCDKRSFLGQLYRCKARLGSQLYCLRHRLDAMRLRISRVEAIIIPHSLVHLIENLRYYYPFHAYYPWFLFGSGRIVRRRPYEPYQYSASSGTKPISLTSIGTRKSMSPCCRPKVGPTQTVLRRGGCIVGMRLGGGERESSLSVPFGSSGAGHARAINTGAGSCIGGFGGCGGGEPGRCGLRGGGDGG